MTYASGNQELTVAPTAEVTYKVVNGTWSMAAQTDKMDRAERIEACGGKAYRHEGKLRIYRRSLGHRPGRSNHHGSEDVHSTSRAEAAVTVTSAIKAKTLTQRTGAGVCTAGEATGDMQQPLGICF